MNKKLVVASDSFKGSLSSIEIGELIKRVVRDNELPFDVHSFPISDGGEGFLESLDSLGFETRFFETVDLDNRIMMAPVLVSDDFYVIEMASVCGLNLNNRELDPWRASTYGLGLLVRKCVEDGAHKIVMGVGGTGTNEAGIGFLRALDFKFLDENDKEIELNLGGIKEISRIVVGDRLEVEIEIATDVKNPLLGENGATYVYGLQKGIPQDKLEEVDDSFAHYANLLNNGNEFVLGCGAAGGLPYSVLSFFESSVVSGIDFVLNVNDFDELLEDCDLVITGEGFADGQSLAGKAISQVIERCRKQNVPVVCICGDYDEDVLEFDVPFYRLREDGLSVRESMARADELYEKVVLEVLKKECL